jgi:hypothetical protein
MYIYGRPDANFRATPFISSHAFQNDKPQLEYTPIWPHDSDIKRNVAIWNREHKPGLNPVAEWKVDAELLEGAKAQRCSARYLPQRRKRLHRHENAGNAPLECSRNIGPYEWTSTFSIVSFLYGPPVAEGARTVANGL